MPSFFNNHDHVEIADFFLAGGFAFQLFFMPQFFCDQALLHADKSISNEMLIICRFAGLFLFSERFVST
jgi:hypothetical protein